LNKSNSPVKIPVLTELAEMTEVTGGRTGCREPANALE